MRAVICLALIFGLANCQNRTFPDDFLIGFATSSYQIEGGWNEDGRGESLWDHYVHTRPEAIADRSNGDVAADSYHKYKEDVQLLKGMGAQIYRFSISWSRIVPDGVDPTKPNQAGIDYYNNLINELLANGIQPMVTLLHGDVPQRLQDLGGWANPLVGSFFAEYARICFDNFGDRVKWWTTFNEPLETAKIDYAGTGGPPGLNLPGLAEYMVVYSILLAHARVYHLYDDDYRQKYNGKIGIVLDGGWNAPASNATADLEAADRTNQFQMGIFAHPIFSDAGDFPFVMRERIGFMSVAAGWRVSSRLSTLSPEMIKYIKGTADFFGVNYYTTTLVSNADPPTGPVPSFENDLGVTLSRDPSWPNEGDAGSGNKVVPWELRSLLNWVRTEYNNIPVFITENGYVDLGGLEDYGRIDLYNRYLQEVLNAIYEDGCNVLGFTAWSLIDNFEWGSGYTLKFGIHSVDFNDPNRPRTPKKSAQFFKDIIASRTLPPINETKLENF